LVDSYRKLSSQRPAKSADPREAEILSRDVAATKAWLSAQQSKLSLPDFLTQNAFPNVKRILSLLARNSDSFNYRPEYDRYAFILYLLGLKFVLASGLRDQIAESLAYYLTKSFLEIANLAQYSSHQDDEWSHFTPLQERLREIAPLLGQEITERNRSLVSLIKTWRKTLFGLQHNVEDVWYIWDRILLRRDILKRYVDELCLAHVAQVRAQDSAAFMRQLAVTSGWDVEEIVRFADEKPRPVASRPSYVQIYNISVAVIVAIVMWYMSKDRFKPN
jgi:hypothetical protein